MIVRRSNSPTRCAATGAPTGFSPCSPGRGNYSDDVERRHRAIAAESGHELRDDFANQPRIVFVPNNLGLPIIVDETDAERVLAKKWSAFFDGARPKVVRLEFPNGVLVRLHLHRFVLDAPDGMLVDHRNGNPLDNRRSNLRLATAKENARNQRAQLGCKSKFKGVCSSVSKRAPWRAYIINRGRQRHLGVFETEASAALAYDAAARDLFGEFAALNFPLLGEQSAFPQAPILGFNSSEIARVR